MEITESVLWERRIKVQSVIDRILQHGEQYEKALAELNNRFKVPETYSKLNLYKENASIRN
jgi:hypothetical protein